MVDRALGTVILVVDDIADVRVSNRLLLEAHGYRVLEAPNAHAAIGIIDSERVDLILADLYMPGSMDGVDLIQHVARTPPPRPAIIAMSGSPHLAYRSSLNAARSVGADAALVKPVDPDILLKTIESLLRTGEAKV